MTGDSSNGPFSRRGFLLAGGGAASLGVAGCLGDDGNGDDGSGDDGGGRSWEVGHGEYQTTVTEADLPEELFVYAVQTGWSNWDAVMAAFEEEYGVPLHDDQRTSGEALSNIRANAGNQDYSAYNGFYPPGSRRGTTISPPTTSRPDGIRFRTTSRPTTVTSRRPGR